MATIPRTGALGTPRRPSVVGGRGGLEVLKRQIAHGRASGEAGGALERVGRRSGPVAGRTRLPFRAACQGAGGEKPLERA